MKKINLITESGIIIANYFKIVDYCGAATVVFHCTEREFVNKSVMFEPLTADLSEVPYKSYSEQGAGAVYSASRDYYVPNDFYIVIDKGSVGFESAILVCKCHIKETDTEYIISVKPETGKELVGKAAEAFRKIRCSLPSFLNDNFFSKINDVHNAAPVIELIKRIESTPFLDLAGDIANSTIQVDVGGKGTYSLRANNPLPPIPAMSMKYKPIDIKGEIKAGDYFFNDEITGAIEIAKVTGFAHSVYGYFYAVLETEFIYPHDSAAIKKKLPGFHKEHCISRSQREFDKFIGQPEIISYLRETSELGDRVINQELKNDNGFFGVSNDIFQFMLSGNRGFGDYELSNGAFIRVERGVICGTLIQVNGKYKIIFYKCKDVVSYKDKYYVQFTYDDESEFFNDFSNASKSGFKKVHYINTCRNVEYLLCRGKIKPVVISKEKYDSFSQSR